MVAFQIEVFLFQRISGDLFRRSVRNGKTELAVRLRGLDKAVRMRLNTGIYAQQDLLPLSFFGTERVQFVELGIGIDGDQSDTAFNGERKFRRQFVIAVQADFFGREPRFERRVQFAAGYDVYTDPLLFGDPIDRHAGKGFRCVQDKPVSAVIRSDRFAVSGAHVADVLFVHHVQRRSEARRKFCRVCAADRKMSGTVDF